MITDITTHPASYLSPYLLENYFDSKTLQLDSAELFYNTFRSLIKNSVSGKSINSKIILHRASAVRGMAPLFVKTDINGKALDLKSFTNKNYVLLYFWASLCRPELGEQRHLKSICNKYHRKQLEVIGLSLDIFEKDWKKAIKENAMGLWHNILIKNDESLNAKYNIGGMPPSILILIDKQGKVIGRYMGYHVDWEKGSDNKGILDDLEKILAESIGR